MKANQVILKPILSEKSTNLIKDKFYMFQVDIKANKFQIKTVLEKLYPVKVEEIKVSIRKGKTRRVGRRMSEKKLQNKKIVFIKLKEGKIDLFPQA